MQGSLGLQRAVVLVELARLEGFEPPTNGFGSRYSIRLSYRREPGIVLDSHSWREPSTFDRSFLRRFVMSASRNTATDVVPAWRRRLGLYWTLVRGDRPIGWLLLLWPTWWGLWLASEGVPPWWILVVFSLGVWLTRSAGCVINDYADRWLDPQVERTKDRPLATGAVRGREALLVFAVLMLVAFGLVWTLNRLTVWMSVVGVVLAASYPYLKRYTYLPQVYLGLAFGWGIPMAFAAIRGEVPTVAWVLYVANIFWTTGYDTWYAMVDREDDLQAGAKSTAILFGDLDLVALGLLYALFFAGLALIGHREQLGVAFWVGMGAAAGFVAYQFFVGRSRERGACFKAFLNNHWVGMAVFVGLAVALWMKR
jgi:4-hydroxybenzoate polyprenyltransferase